MPIPLVLKYNLALTAFPFGSPNRCISDFADAPSKFLATLGTSDMPKTLCDMPLCKRFEGTDEVVIRASINRSYYYVYHYIMRRCRQKVIHFKEKKNIKIPSHRISEIL